MKNIKPHASMIRQMCKVAAVWLIASNLLTSLSYPVFAADERNTATYSSGSDGYTVTYNGKSYTLASSDLPWTYYWWNNIAWDTTTYFWTENNDRWWWWWDTSSNWYDSWNPRSERQWPCGDGWHVPSRWEWTAIMTAWCHLDSNSCTSSDISNWYISNSTLASAFKTDFSMTNGGYWSSSPDADYDYVAWVLGVYDYGISPGNDDYRNFSGRVRCLKNSTSAQDDPSSSVLTWDEVESRSAAGTLTAKSFSFIMPNHDVYLYAITAPNTYHVHYDGNGATSWTMVDSDYTYDRAGTLKANAFEKWWYTWTGWNTQANGGGTAYGSGATVLNWTATDGETIPIYAQWSVNGYEITYLLNSWSVSPANPATYTIETPTFTLNSPDRTNSTFLWWSWTDISWKSQTVTIAQWSVWNRIYEANFVCNTWYHLSWTNNCINNTYSVVVYDGDGTHGAADPVVFTYDNTGSLPAMPSQSWYDFVWWEVTWMSGWVTHYIGTITTTWDSYTYSGSTNEFMNLTIEQWGIVTLTALWEARNDTKYEVYHYIKNVGSDTYTLSWTDYLSWTTDTDVVFTEKLKTFTWFVYSGWYLTGGTTRPAWAGVTTWNIEKDGSLKIYLYYDRINYNVYLSGDAGVDTLSGAGAYEYGATVTVTATPKTWYHFVRWEKRKSDWTTE